MPVLLIKVTLLFMAALIALVAAKRSTAAMRHLVCLCALAGSLILPLASLLPSYVISIQAPALIAVTASRAAAPQNRSWSTIIFALWALGALVLLLRLAIGHWRIARILRAATPIRPGLFRADVSVPIACGLLRPAVLMPRASTEWPDWQTDAAVRHELMHIRRRDLQANFVAQLATAFYWFHPLAWLLAAQLRNNQETACDDAVLFTGFEPATYAEALLAMARTSAQISTPTLIPGCPMTTQTNLKSRITRLLDRGIARTTSRRNLLQTAAVFAIVLAVVGIAAPKISRAQSDQVYKVGGDVTPPRVLYKVDPAYTEDAHEAKISGTVTLSLTVGADGLARDISIVKSLDAGLDRNAAEVLQQWRFAPGMLKGEPVAVRAMIEVNFRLL